ncbi:MAG: hypothetical protein Q4E67_03425 [Planctomycetia bacterium]|nr:hypothetical protein [Planctomycetia bacterium]
MKNEKTSKFWVEMVELINYLNNCEAEKQRARLQNKPKFEGIQLTPQQAFALKRLPDVTSDYVECTGDFLVLCRGLVMLELAEGVGGCKMQHGRPAAIESFKRSPLGEMYLEWLAGRATESDETPAPRAHEPKTPKAEGGEKTAPPTFNTLSGDGKRDVLITLREEMVRREAVGRKMTDKEIIDFVNSTKLCKVGKNALVGDTNFSKIVEGLRKNSSVWTKNSGDLMDKISE